MRSEKVNIVEKWYVLYTSPKAEKQVALRLDERGTEYYLPLHLSPRKWSDRIKMVEVPLFPSYIFIKTLRADLYDLVRVPGISRVLYFQSEPATLTEKEILLIKQFLEIARGKACSYEIDEEVKIAIGPLAGSVGKIKTVKGKYVVLTMTKLGLSVRVEKDKLLKI